MRILDMNLFVGLLTDEELLADIRSTEEDIKIRQIRLRHLRDEQRRRIDKLLIEQAQ